MSISESGKAKDATLTRDVLAAFRYYIGGRRALLILGVAALAGGLAFNWSWLVAIGAAPIILSVAPCLVMCALGLCMHKTFNGPAQPSTGEGQSSHAASCCHGIESQPAKDKS